MAARVGGDSDEDSPCKGNKREPSAEIESHTNMTSKDSLPEKT